MGPQFFADQLAFRAWLERNHATKKELVVGFHKVGTGKPSMTWSESVDQALCFGWIDGVRRSHDAESYTIRFTPRKPTSNWSAINIRKIADLTKQGLMRPAGIEAFKKRKEEKSGIYGYENRPKELPAPYEKLLKANKPAWEYFARQAPSYQKTMYHWILSAKKEETQLSRLDKVIAASAKQKRIF
jgi:uncharacterized protein YdeI (YjbR/CyaY-like superfamily)